MLKNFQSSKTILSDVGRFKVETLTSCINVCPRETALIAVKGSHSFQHQTIKLTKLNIDDGTFLQIAHKEWNASKFTFDNPNEKIEVASFSGSSFSFHIRDFSAEDAGMFMIDSYLYNENGVRISNKTDVISLVTEKDCKQGSHILSN